VDATPAAREREAAGAPAAREREAGGASTTRSDPRPVAVALIDGEHYPPVVVDALRALSGRYTFVAALFLGGEEKLRDRCGGRRRSQRERRGGRPERERRGERRW
jgi:hypothetical protein